MRAKVQEKQRAIKLRQKGWTLPEICRELKISKSTCFLWVKDVKLDQEIINYLASRKTLAQVRGRVGYRKIRERRDQLIHESAIQTLNQVKLNLATKKLLCALLYWAEGEKRTGKVAFSNSDPKMVKTFMTLLRKNFQVDKNKFRALLNLHQYNNQEKQKQFWAKVTGIPQKRINIYNKPNSGKNTRPGYPGCISVRYYDVRLAREIEYLYTEFITHLGA